MPLNDPTLECTDVTKNLVSYKGWKLPSLWEELDARGLAVETAMGVSTDTSRCIAQYALIAGMDKSRKTAAYAAPVHMGI